MAGSRSGSRMGGAKRSCNASPPLAARGHCFPSLWASAPERSLTWHTVPHKCYLPYESSYVGSEQCSPTERGMMRRRELLLPEVRGAPRRTDLGEESSRRGLDV